MPLDLRESLYRSERGRGVIVAAVEGFATEQFAGLRTAFEEQVASGADVGASLCCYLGGELVVDLWGGTRDAAGEIPWTPDTLVNVWSTTKTMTFLAGLMLADRGLLDFDAPVATYWPEFAAGGKEYLPVKYLFSHSAGLSGWDPALIGPELADWDLATSRLAAQTPWWEPGTVSGYHALTQGHLIGEVVRRITGKSFGTFFAEEIAKPLGADFFVGLPESEEHRVSPVIPGQPMSGNGQGVESIAVRTLLSAQMDAGTPNERWWRAAEIPAANGHGNAKSVATIQDVITGRGTHGGVRLLSEAGVDRLFEKQIEGRDLVLNFDLAFGLGYGLASATIPIGPRACFWGGYGGSLIIMDQDSGLTFSYMMNKMAPELIGDTRGFTLAMHAAMAAAS